MITNQIFCENFLYLKYDFNDSLRLYICASHDSCHDMGKIVNSSDYHFLPQCNTNLYKI